MEIYKEKIIDLRFKKRKLEREEEKIARKITAQGFRCRREEWEEIDERLYQLDDQIEELNDDIKDLRIIVAEETQSPEEPQKPDIPKELEGIIRKAIAEGFINPTTYAWTESDALFGRFVWQCNRKLGLQKNGKTNYNIFSFIPNYKEIIGGAKNAMTRRCKERSTQIGAKGIDDLFA